MQKKYLILFLLHFICLNLFSQQYFFRNFSINDGLPQSTVYCMLQDSRGYIWMGTDGGGVCKYDGRNIEIINKSKGLTGNTVRSLFEDSKGNIWIGTDNGITVYDGYEYMSIGEDEDYYGGFALRIVESRIGEIFVGTNDAGLYRIKLADSLEIKNYTTSSGLVSEFIFDIYEDDSNRLWLAMIGGISIVEFNNEDESVDVKKLIEGRDIPSGFITCIEPNKKGQLLFGTYGTGAFIIKNPLEYDAVVAEKIDESIIPKDATIWDILQRKNGETWFATADLGIISSTEQAVQIYNKENAIETNQILDIIEDAEGNLWFSSMGSGAYLFAGNELVSYGKNEGIPYNDVNSVYVSQNKIYVGTNEGLSIFKMNNNALIKMKQYTIKDGLSDNNVKAIVKDDDGVIWLGTDKGLNVISDEGIEVLSAEDGLIHDKINCIFIDENKNIWIGTDDCYSIISADHGIDNPKNKDDFIDVEMQSIIQDKKGQIWIGTLGGLVRLRGKDYIDYTDFNEEEGLNDLVIHSLAEDCVGNIWIGTFGGGLYKFDISTDSLPIKKVADKETLSSNNIYSLVFKNDTSLIVGTDKGFDYLFLNKNQDIKKLIHYTSDDGFVGEENNINAITKDSEDNIWFGTIKGLIKYNQENISTNKKLPKTFITNLKLAFEEVNWDSRKIQKNKWFNTPKDLELSYKDNHVSFDFSGIYFEDPKDLEYSYFLEGQSKSWSPYIKKTEVVFQSLPPGDYTFKVKSKNKYNNVSTPDELSFEITPPFYKRVWFIASCFIVFIISIIVFIRYRESKLKKDKIILEKTVHERTQEVVKQKDEIEEQKQEITDSIEYAKTIQRAVLPNENILTDAFSDSFILFKPKDIVSGDFYWMSKKSNHVIFTAADCTGHGVPGAFMSMLGVSFLNEIVNVKGIVKPDLILNNLRENIVNSLQQKGLSQENKDGMDIAICSFDQENNKFYYAGANNPLILIRKTNDNYELTEIKADRMPVAIYTKMDSFICHEIDLVKGDSIYMFSDGYVDQFGGPKGKKFMKKNFKNLLLDIQDKGMDQQHEELVFKLNAWMKKENNCKPYEQIDDIVVLGVKI